MGRPLKYWPGMPKDAFLWRCHATDASAIVAIALEYRVITRQPCAVCGRAALAHHYDYNRPLDVIWLCTRHHREEHVRLGRGIDEPATGYVGITKELWGVLYKLPYYQQLRP